MQDNTVDVAGDSCAVRSRLCASDGVVDCIVVVFWIVSTLACVLSRSCLLTYQRKCLVVITERRDGDGSIEKERGIIYNDKILKDHWAKVPCRRVIQFNWEDWTSKSFVY